MNPSIAGIYENITQESFRTSEHNKNAEKTDFKPYLKSLNENFQVMDKKIGSDGNKFEHYTYMYENCDKVLRQLVNKNLERVDNKYYGMLDKYGVVVDWIPAYSKNFQLKNQINQTICNLLEAILHLIINLGVIAIGVGRNIRDTLLKVNLGQLNIKPINIPNNYNEQIKFEELKFENISIYQISNTK